MERINDLGGSSTISEMIDPPRSLPPATPMFTLPFALLAVEEHRGGVLVGLGKFKAEIYLWNQKISDRSREY